MVALGRAKTRTVATSPDPTTDTYSFIGTGEIVCRISSVAGASNVTVDSLIASDGSRLGTKAGSLFGLLIPDLHGNVAAAVSADFTSTTDALRYDAYGSVAAAVTSALPTPWRYQGRLLVSPSGSADLYDAGARFYSPGLGAFTGLDSVTGSAQNPITMNRYLYANGNPATLIDPSGHCGQTDSWSGCETRGAADFVTALDTTRDSGEQIWSATHPKAKDTSSDTDPHSLERRLTQDDFETPEAAA